MIIRKKFPETVSLVDFCDDNDITITVTSGRDSYGDLIVRAEVFGFAVQCRTEEAALDSLSERVQGLTINGFTFPRMRLVHD